MPTECGQLANATTAARVFLRVRSSATQTVAPTTNCGCERAATDFNDNAAGDGSAATIETEQMILTGAARLGKDAELRTTTSGEPVANFDAAFNYGRKDNDGNRPTQWVRCTLWGRQAESLTQYLVKGQQVSVVLRDVHIEEYEGRNGWGANLVGTVSDIELVGGRPEGYGSGQQAQRQGARTGASQQQAPRNASAPQPQRQQPAPDYDSFDDDIPF